jgi:hypothetical protein
MCSQRETWNFTQGKGASRRIHKRGRSPTQRREDARLLGAERRWSFHAAQYGLIRVVSWSNRRRITRGGGSPSEVAGEPGVPRMHAGSRLEDVADVAARLMEEGPDASLCAPSVVSPGWSEAPMSVTTSLGSRIDSTSMCPSRVDGSVGVAAPTCIAIMWFRRHCITMWP